MESRGTLSLVLYAAFLGLQGNEDRGSTLLKSAKHEDRCTWLKQSVSLHLV